jgi:DNA-binding LacI/PurR family transcriptional regulator
VDTVTRVTLQTVADRVGVSRMTVSNAFSRPDQLSTALREKVLAAAAELGYVGPDPAARALARGTAGAIGVLMTDSLAYAFTDEVATGFLGAVADGLAPTGLAMTLLTSGVRDGHVPARDVPMDGALVYSCGFDSSAVDWLTRRGLPMVFVDQVPVPGIPSVNVDDRGGARAAAQHLIDLGHRRIGIVNSEHTENPCPGGRPPRPASCTCRTSGCSAGPMPGRGGLEPVLTREAVRPAEWAAGEVERPEDVDARAVRDLLERPDRPTAVLCFSDVMAYRVVRTAEELGLRVPRTSRWSASTTARWPAGCAPLSPRSPGRGREGPGSHRGPDGRDRGGQDGEEAEPREARRAAHRARGPGQHRTAGRLSAARPRRTG